MHPEMTSDRPRRSHSASTSFFGGPQSTSHMKPLQMVGVMDSSPLPSRSRHGETPTLPEPAQPRLAQDRRRVAPLRRTARSAALRHLRRGQGAGFFFVQCAAARSSHWDPTNTSPTRVRSRP